MARRGPGLLAREILTGKDAQAEGAARIIAEVAPDVILLNGFDYDLDAVALTAFADRIRTAGLDYPYAFSARPNTGRMTTLDLDGDGRRGGPGDAQGYGRFAGDGGMAILSRLPLDINAARDFSALLWADFPGALLPEVDGAPFPSADAQAAQMLSTTGHWDVPVLLPDGRSLHLLAWHASPPVFDGPEDRNGRRNHDETAFWQRLLDGDLVWPAPDGPFVILGDANLDPVDGDGRGEAMRALLADPRLTDPLPTSKGGPAAARAEAGPNATHTGDPAFDTTAWADVRNGPGNLRVDYVLPSANLTVEGSGVFWPAPSDPLRDLLSTKEGDVSRHRVVWVDIAFP